VLIRVVATTKWKIFIHNLAAIFMDRLATIGILRDFEGF